MNSIILLLVAFVVVLCVGAVKGMRHMRRESTVIVTAYQPGFLKSLGRAVVAAVLFTIGAVTLIASLYPDVAGGIGAVLVVMSAPWFFVAALIFDLVLDRFLFWQNRSVFVKIFFLLILVVIAFFVLQLIGR